MQGTVPAHRYRPCQDQRRRGARRSCSLHDRHVIDLAHLHRLECMGVWRLEQYHRRALDIRPSSARQQRTSIERYVYTASGCRQHVRKMLWGDRSRLHVQVAQMKVEAETHRSLVNRRHCPASVTRSRFTLHQFPLSLLATRQGCLTPGSRARTGCGFDRTTD